MTINITHSMDYIIGLDGGGSKTLAMVASLDGTILGEGTAGPSNPHANGLSAAFTAIESAIQAAQGAAGLSALPRAICLGLAGAEDPEEFELISDWLQARFPDIRQQIVNDAWLVLAAGTPAGVGVAVISGTGSISVSRGLDGKTARAGGWGYLFGDEGSGYAIGLEALRKVSQAADGRAPATLLTEMLLSYFGMQDPSELIGKIYNLKVTRTKLARLAVLVQTAADKNDPAAINILTKAGADLAAGAIAAAHQVGLSGSTPVASAGGVMLHWPALQDAFKQSISKSGLEPNPFTLVAVPALGAINLARRMLE